MRCVRFGLTVMFVVVCCFVSTGCIDAVREGIADGLSGGIRGALDRIVEAGIQSVTQGG